MKTRQTTKIAAKIDRAIARGWKPGRGSVSAFARKRRQAAGGGK